MKLLLPILFFLGSYAVHAQDVNRSLDELMHNKTLANFEQSIGFEYDHYLDPELLQYANRTYSIFFDSLRKQFMLGNYLNQAEIDLAYDGLVQRSRLEVSKKKPKPPVNGPIPKNSTCSNFGFEEGNFGGWDLFQGSVTGPAPFSFQGPVTVAPGVQHTLMTGGIDQITGLPMVNPQFGGNYSLLLGDGGAGGTNAARVRRTFVVDASTAYIQYSYLVVFQSPVSHLPADLPYFIARVTHVGGNTALPCSEYAVVADSTTASQFNVIPGAFPGNDILYTDWTTVVVNLSQYMGQTVTLEITAGDCGLGAHYGYAYVDASCGLGVPPNVTDTVCIGDSITLTAPAGADQYLWDTGDTTQSIVVDTAGVYTVTLTPVQLGSCGFDVVYTVEEYVRPEADFTQSVDSICANESVSFNEQSSIPPPGVIIGYQWDFGDGTVTGQGTGPIVGLANTTGTYDAPTHTYTSPGTYIVAFTAIAGNGCERVVTDTVFVLSNPAIWAGPDLFFCDTSDVTLTVFGTPTNAQWDQGVQNGVPFTLPPGTSNIYTVVDTNSIGCNSSDQVLVEVYHLPPVDAGPDVAICIGDQVMLSGSGAIVYSWDNGITDSVSFTPTLGTVTYTVTGEDANGCINTDQVDVTVNPLPIVDAGADQILCEVTPVVLNGTGSPNLVWNNGVTDGVAFDQAVGTVTYTMFDTLQTGCFASDSVQVEILPNPVFDFQDTSICYGDSAIYDGGSLYSYVWTGGVQNNTYFTPEQTATYIVTGTAPNGCSINDTVVVSVYPNPIAAFNILDTALTTLNPITGFENLTTGASFYEWDFGDGSGINYDFEPTHEFPFQFGGTYEITLIGISDQGCLDSAKRVLTVFLEQTIFVPNTFTPNGDEHNQVFKPIINGYDENDYVLYIYNRWGELIFESRDVNTGWDATYSKHGYQVQDGIYTWKIEIGLLDSADKESFTGHVTILR